MLLLAGNGVPMEKSARWSRARRRAAVIAIGEMEGGTYDWIAGRWIGMEGG